MRQKCRLKLPTGAKLNALNQLEYVDIDLGIVISADAVCEYDTEQWHSNVPNAQPSISRTEVIIEYAAHPKAKLYVATGSEAHAVFDLSTFNDEGIVQVAPAYQEALAPHR